MKYSFVINPVAGKRQKQTEFVKSIKDYFAENSGEYEIFYTAKQGDAKNYAEKLAKKGEVCRIYACGGEGTAFEVLNGIIGYDNISLGVVPCGSANDFISYFSDREIFMDVAAQIDGDEFGIDLIKVGENYAMNSCSVGMDAMVAANMSKFKNLPFVSGKMAYILSTVYTLFSKIGVNLKIILDEGKKKISKKSLFAVIANAPFYGGGFNPTPAANPFDNELDFSVISVVSRLRILSLIKKYKEGTHINLDCCEYGRCKSAVIEADREVPLNMDGEIIYTKKIDFSVVEDGVKLILPKTISEVWKNKTKKVLTN